MKVPYDPYPHRRGEPRQFVIWWTAYVLCSSIFAFASASSSVGYVSYEVTRPAASILLAMLGLGIGVLWPMVRLSQQVPPGGPAELGGAFALDGLVMLVPAVVVAVAQCMPWMSAWPASVATALLISYASWAFLGAALLRRTHLRARNDRGIPRWRAMLLQIFLCAVGPLAALGASSLSWAPQPLIEALLTTSPITAPLEITADRAWSGQAAAVSWWHLVGAAIPGFAGLCFWLGWPRDRGLLV